ncbi:MAG: hypothetical protein K2P99_00590 [Burkholderiales bacterium]|nr:hypothetical protein [Burkholderiales bacterium]
MAPKQSNNDKFSIVESFFRYLSNNSKLTLVFHLVWIIVACISLSTTYILAFHFPSLLKVYEEAHSIRAFDKNLKVSLKQDDEINKILTQVMNENKASRAYIFRFHNGLAAVSGIPFFFQTNTHEIITPGMSRVLPFSQRLPASINVPMNTQLANNKCVILNKISADPNNQNYYNYQSRGAEAMIRCPIFLDNGDLLGYVGLDYSSPISDLYLKETETSLRSTARSLSLLFSNTRK